MSENHETAAPKFGAQSTAREVIAGQDLTGRNAIVTGGASGIGVETALALATAGARVVIATRLKSGRETCGSEAADVFRDAYLEVVPVETYFPLGARLLQRCGGGRFPTGIVEVLALSVRSVIVRL